MSESYSKFFLYYDDAPVLTVNSTYSDFISNEEHYDSLVEQILSMRGSHQFFSLTLAPRRLKYLTEKELAELQLHAQHVLRSEIFQRIEDARRQERLNLKIAGLSIDHSRQLVDDSTLDILLNLYKKSNTNKIKADYLKGEPVNLTENLASLHMAMRDGMPDLDQQLKQQITSNQNFT